MNAQNAQRKPESPHGRSEEVQQLLDRMARAITSGDGESMAELWETPALVMGDEQVLAVTSDQQVAQFFGGAKEQYNARGITDTRGEIVRSHWPTENIVFVEVRWPYLDAKGNVLGEETSTYTLRRDERGHLRMRAAVMHGAKEG
jgi:hypothetical protein